MEHSHDPWTKYVPQFWFFIKDLVMQDYSIDESRAEELINLIRQYIKINSKEDFNKAYSVIRRLAKIAPTEDALVWLIKIYIKHPEYFEDSQYIVFIQNALKEYYSVVERGIKLRPLTQIKDVEDLLDVIEYGQRKEEIETMPDKSDPALWYHRAREFQRRIGEAERVIIENKAAMVAYLYAKDIIKGRWPEAESFISSDPHVAYLYAKDIIKGRWPEAENYILADSTYGEKYIDFLRQIGTPENTIKDLTDIYHAEIWAQEQQESTKKGANINLSHIDAALEILRRASDIGVDKAILLVEQTLYNEDVFKQVSAALKKTALDKFYVDKIDELIDAFNESSLEQGYTNLITPSIIDMIKKKLESKLTTEEKDKKEFFEMLDKFDGTKGQLEDIVKKLPAEVTGYLSIIEQKLKEKGTLDAIIYYVFEVSKRRLPENLESRFIDMANVDDLYTYYVYFIRPKRWEKAESKLENDENIFIKYLSEIRPTNIKLLFDKPSNFIFKFLQVASDTNLLDTYSDLLDKLVGNSFISLIELIDKLFPNGIQSLRHIGLDSYVDKKLKNNEFLDSYRNFIAKWTEDSSLQQKYPYIKELLEYTENSRIKEKEQKETENETSISESSENKNIETLEKPETSSEQSKETENNEGIEHSSSWFVSSFIKKVKNKWCVFSEKGKRMGCYPTKEEAKKRLRQIEYFKHKASIDFDSFLYEYAKYAVSTMLPPRKQQIFMQLQASILKQLIEEGVLSQNDIIKIVTTDELADKLRNIIETGIDQNKSNEEIKNDILDNFIPLISTAAELLEGGLGDDKPDWMFDPKQLQKGIEIEMEHTNDPEKAKEIAKDHLTEIPDYYTRLEKMEKSTEVENV